MTSMLTKFVFVHFVASIFVQMNWKCKHTPQVILNSFVGYYQFLLDQLQRHPSFIIQRCCVQVHQFNILVDY
jgi:hypothetical protein